jgi:hypothetical protein
VSPLKIKIPKIPSKNMREKQKKKQQLFIQFINYVVFPTCFGITLPSSGSVPSAF